MSERNETTADKLAIDRSVLLAEDIAMGSFRMEGSLPLDHDDILCEEDGELMVVKADGSVSYVS